MEQNLPNFCIVCLYNKCTFKAFEDLDDLGSAAGALWVVQRDNQDSHLQKLNKDVLGNNLI